MRLISCHVENFGKLQNFSMDFTEGANLICQENAWGKSTFAAFIRAMFYGLEGERKRSIEENERKRYKPWQGGAFGGSLTFEIAGKQYIISRVFREKEAQDEFELRDAETNLISRDYSAKLGEELFHINRESFLRTVFIGQSDCETVVTDDINAQIGNLTDNAKDLNSFEAASARLTELINSLTPNRVTGSLARRTGEIAKLERIVGDGSRIGESLDTYRGYLEEEQSYYEQLKEQMNEVCEQQARVSSLQVVLAKKEEWNRLKSTRDSRAADWQAARDKFPGQVPPMPETEDTLTKALSLEKLSERVALYSLDESEISELEKLQEMFQNGLPVQKEAAEILEGAKELRTLRRLQTEVSLSDEEKVRLDALETIFGQVQSEVTPVISDWNECRKRQATLPSDQAALAALQSAKELEDKQKKHWKKLSIAGIIIGVAVFAGGIFAAILASLVPGIGITVVGVVLLLLGSMGLRKVQSSVNPQLLCDMDYLQEKIETDERFVEERKGAVLTYLESCGKAFSSDEDVTDQLHVLAEEFYEYIVLKKKAERQQQYDQTQEIEALCGKISAYLKQYRINFSEETLSENLHELKNNAVRYTTLREKTKQGTFACEEYAKTLQSVCAFLKRYSYFPENDFRKQLSKIKEDTDTYLDAEKWMREAERVLATFEQETDADLLTQDLPTEELPTLEELNQTVQRLTGYMEKSHNAILEYNRRLEDMQEQYDDLEESKLHLEEMKAIHSQEKKKFDHLTKARIYLGLAKESITAKYAAPIFQSFCHYFELITKNSAEKYRIDANTSLTVEEKGRQREINTLSAGYRDLVGICLRIALVDAMYTEEVPMIIMDDPFTNLDDEKTKATMEFLQEIGKKYQVIYFTCSEGRCRNTSVAE